MTAQQKPSPKKPKRHVMLDIETLGNTTTAPIVQIGVVCFQGGKTYQEVGSYSTNIYFKSALSYGDANGDTLEWWLKQSDEARLSITKDSGKPITTLKKALEGLSETMDQWKNGDEFSLEYWAHASFDFPIMNHACEKTWVSTPFYYRNCRDLRTIESMYQVVTGKDFEWIDREGVYHNAEDDARHQAKNLHKMLLELNNLVLDKS